MSFDDALPCTYERGEIERPVQLATELPTQCRETAVDHVFLGRRERQDDFDVFQFHALIPCETETFFGAVNDSSRSSLCPNSRSATIPRFRHSATSLSDSTIGRD